MFILILAFVLTVIFTYILKKILLEAEIVDKPIVTEHKHKIGTPTMGGLGFLLTASMVAMVLGDRHLNLIVLTMVIAGIIGALDDLLGLSIKEKQKIVKNISSEVVELGRLNLQPSEEARVATKKAKQDFKKLMAEKKIKVVGEVPIKKEFTEKQKIMLQCIPGIFLALSFGVGSIFGYFLGFLTIPIVIFGVLGAINAINLIDGMDGMAAGIIAISSLFCAFYSSMKGLHSSAFLMLSGISLGFLVFNRFPASIFMGDVGSFALGAGYAAAVMMNDIIYYGVLAIAVPIVSVIISLMHRANIIKLPVEPLHHTLHYKGLSEKTIVITYWLITFVLCSVGLIMYNLGLFP
ncbi:Phospho-N-acetylmuramoyl-pentapeptide-transferase [Methanothermus fervidus DSM 2088]|uniref:Phospho-N-acetylmuramoyl-pentapeptide-transferase n=1 Tax=Methanothermus fervidus (strain ATCC 43054 / DSM 2088 / JCM 10308 / V24 S) TaxID=523846 RepID=E3GZ28_METFV|nr:glycosyltransferase family 4 protein [Methanothermus fervidus]ADP77560.1 Phospho-N-acetylmuramoyl-pentapeptide-transferase [Methanothermus fervidus DSM 2088]